MHWCGVTELAIFFIMPGEPIGLTYESIEKMANKILNINFKHSDLLYLPFVHYYYFSIVKKQINQYLYL